MVAIQRMTREHHIVPAAQPAEFLQGSPALSVHIGQNHGTSWLAFAKHRVVCLPEKKGAAAQHFEAQQELLGIGVVESPEMYSTKQKDGLMKNQ